MIMFIHGRFKMIQGEEYKISGLTLLQCSRPLSTSLYNN